MLLQSRLSGGNIAHPKHLGIYSYSCVIGIHFQTSGFRGVAGGWVTCDIPVARVQLSQEQLDQQAPLGLHLLVDTMEMDTIEITKKLWFKVWKVVGLSSMQNVDPPKERK